MPVATVDFECEYDGELIRLTAGLDQVAEGHELVRRFPRHFAPAVRRDTSPPATCTKMRGTPRLRKGPPRLTVALGSSARRAIEEEFLSTTRVDGYETGGWLFAEPSRSWDKSIEVRLATGPGEGARRGRSSYEPSDYHQAEEQLARDGADHLCRVGDWHSHPGHDTTPSSSDLDVWQTCFVRANEKRGVSFYVGLIAALNRQGFPRMRLNAYALSYDRSGRVVCEPATLNDRKDDPWHK
jgi:proteasome lid subunit RPN8/RPN11